MITNIFGGRYRKENVAMCKYPGRRYLLCNGCLYAFAIGLMLMNFIRMFDNTFWGDEAYTIRLAQMSFSEMIQDTANDVHPPLYYIIVQIICRILGYHQVSYHMASLLPYTVLMIFSLTVLRKCFGTLASVSMMTMLSIMDHAIVYNVEVRMYSLGAMFTVLSFWELLKILEKNEKKHYMWFVLASLGAAYTHYYCLISVAFYYFVLLILAIVKKKEYLKNVMISCILTVAGYLPWFMVLLRTFQRTSENWWSTEIPSFYKSVGYIFTNNYNKILMLLFVISFATAILTDFIFVEKTKVHRRERIQISSYNIWLLSGMLSIFGTIIVGIGVSYMIRPLYLLRYLYPVSVVAWLMLSTSVSRLKWGNRIASCIVVMLVVCGSMPQYANTVVTEKNMNEKLEHTLSVTLENISEDALIMSNDTHFCWTVLDYYYPEINYQKLDFSALDSDMNEEYWFILTYELGEDTIDELLEKGYSCQKYIHRGVIGISEVYVYKVDTKNM